jgi:hypothetical protein
MNGRVFDRVAGRFISTARLSMERGIRKAGIGIRMLPTGR